MKFLSWIGYTIIGVLVVVCGNIIYSVLSYKVAEWEQNKEEVR